jgi:SOS-response transcriptional repressor LexA
MLGNLDFNHLGSIFINADDMEEQFPSAFPSKKREYQYDEFDLDDFLFGSIRNTIVFRVSGDSMVEAGIFDGDIALVEKEKTASTGDIIIAFIDNKYSIRYLARDKNGRPFLRPANKKYTDIHPDTDLQIFGVVTSIVRKY